MLAACSTHFQSLFSNAPVNGTHTQLFVILDGTRADDLHILLQYMYKGEAYLHQDRIGSVIRTAEALQIKGLCDKNLGGGSGVGTSSSAMGGSSGALGGSGSGPSGPSPSGSSASNVHAYMSPPHDPSPHRSTVGIMGHMRPHIRKEHRDLSRGSEPHRDLENRSVTSLLREASIANEDGHGPAGGGSGGGHASARPMSPPGHPADHEFAFPNSRAGSSNDAYSSIYGAGGFRGGLPAFEGGGGSSNRDYSPGGERDRSPPRGRSYGSASSSTPMTVVKEDRDAYFDQRVAGSRSGSLSGHLERDRGTPASEKSLVDRHTPQTLDRHTPGTLDRHTPASHHGGTERDRDYDPRNRNSPAGTPTSAKFPSDSTTDYAKAAISSTYKDRIRRDSGPAAPDPGGNEAEPERKFSIQDYRREVGDPPLRARSPSARSTGIDFDF